MLSKLLGFSEGPEIRVKGRWDTDYIFRELSISGKSVIAQVSRSMEHACVSFGNTYKKVINTAGVDPEGVDRTTLHSYMSVCIGLSPDCCAFFHLRISEEASGLRELPVARYATELAAAIAYIESTQCYGTSDTVVYVTEKEGHYTTTLEILKLAGYKLECVVGSRMRPNGYAVYKMVLPAFRPRTLRYTYSPWTENYTNNIESKELVRALLENSISIDNVVAAIRGEPGSQSTTGTIQIAESSG